MSTTTSSRPRRFALIAGGAAFGIAALIGPAVAANAAPVAPTATQSTEAGNDQRLKSVRGVAVTVENATGKPFTIWDHSVNPGEKFAKAGAGGAFSADQIGGSFIFPNGNRTDFTATNTLFDFPTMQLGTDYEFHQYSEGETRTANDGNHTFKITRQGDTSGYKEFTIKVTDVR